MTSQRRGRFFQLRIPSFSMASLALLLVLCTINPHLVVVHAQLIEQINFTILETVSPTDEGENSDYVDNVFDDVMDCPLCIDPSHQPQDSFSVFSAGEDITLTCERAFALRLRLPIQNCTAWQQRGSTICQCAAKPVLPKNDCTLCEDQNEPLPFPSRAATTTKICAQLQVEAVRDEPHRCSIWQQTYGMYCGCDNSLVTTTTGGGYQQQQGVCRLCARYDSLSSQVLLSNPMKLVKLLASDGISNIEKSCGQLEFEANLPGDTCATHQLLYHQECCETSSSSDTTTIEDTLSDAPRLSLAKNGWVLCIAVLWSRFTGFRL